MRRIAVGDGVRYAVRDRGAGPPLLLLHGFTGSGATWAMWLPGLLRTHRTIAIDLLGHGRSDSPASERHAVERQAADLATILGRLDASPADVLGYSFGARIALRLALDSPASVRRLVLECPSAGIADAVSRGIRRDADRLWVEQLQHGDMDGFVRDWAAQGIFASQQRLSSSVRERLAAERAANAPQGLANSLLGGGQGVMVPVRERLGDIRVPTLVVSGRLDPTGNARAAEVAAGIPGAVHEAIDDAGHTPHVEAPELFGDLVTSFLAAPVTTPTPTLSP